MTSTFSVCFIGAILGLALCQTPTSQTINLDGNDQLKLRIVFQPEQQQQSPCSTGNCGQQQQQTIQQSPCSTGNCGQQQVVQQSPCSTGNCGQSQQVVQQSPCSSGNCQSAQTSSCSTGNCGQQQQSPCSTGNCPSYDSTTTTTQTPVTINTNNFKVIRIPNFSSGCSSGGCRWFRPRCPGCQRRRFFMPRFFSPSSSSSGSIGIPDTVYANGRAYAAPIRIPTSYSDGNPVFGRSG